jgi:hypothetical protein
MVVVVVGAFLYQNRALNLKYCFISTWPWVPALFQPAVLILNAGTLIKAWYLTEENLAKGGTRTNRH